MALISLGDMAQSFMLRRQNLALKSDMRTLSAELVSGHAADIARQTGGDLAPLSAIDASLSRLAAYGVATADTALFTGAMQSALSTVDGLASDIAVPLLQAAETGHDLSMDSLATDARQKFETAVAAFNTRVGDRSLFAGQGTDGPALANAETILTALDAAIAGAMTAGEVETAVAAWFDDPSGYVATAYLGGAALEPVSIAPGETARIGITALDPAIRDTLKGLALAALLDRGALGSATAERANLARRAGESLVAGATGRAHLAAGLGIVEGQIEAAQARNGAETSALQIARTGIVLVDPYETATRLEATQTQLETLYTITARMTRLSLVDFLR